MALGTRLAQYNPARVKAGWGVIPLLNGIAPGTFITLERRSRTWTLPVGVDGETARVRTNDFTGIVTFTLRNGSLTNTALTVALQIDEITGLTPAPFYLTDFSGLTFWASPVAFLEGWPNESFGAGENTRTWTLLCSPLIPGPGGSKSL
jgi:hypothetical protein